MPRADPRFHSRFDERCANRTQNPRGRRDVPWQNRRHCSMALAAGTKLGSYEIAGALGAGGMGEVYRARDTKLGRDVAIKILPEIFAHDPERLARFEREAQLLAALNHPHIAAIYGLEEIDAARFIVMELVDGESLAAKLAASRLSVDEALAIARQIVDAF